MLKKPAVILLMLLYIITVSGFALNFHYCFNRLSSVKIDAPSKACTKVLPTGKMKCCKDRHTEVKVNDTHQGEPGSSVAKIFAFILPRLSPAQFALTPQNVPSAEITYRGPPPASTPAFLKNRTFRI